MKRRLLIVLEAGDVYPSGYVRGMMYQEYFEKAGFDVRCFSRQCVPLIRFLFAPPAWAAPLLSRALSGLLYRVADVLAYVNEWFIIHSAKSADIVYTSKVVSLRFLQGIRRKTKARLILDFGDALWLPSARTRRFEEVLRLADHVTTDNEATARYVVPINPKCTVVPDSPQVEEFDRFRYLRTPIPDRVILGWVGTPSTLYNLYVLWEALERLFIKYPQLHLRLLGTGSDARFLPPFEQVRYTCVSRYDRLTMIREVLKMDIGLFPLQNVQASQVRGILKATVYMAGEAAVAASPIGQSVSLIQDGKNGVLADSQKEWEDKIEMLIQNSERRRQIARTGLQTVRKDFMAAQSFEKLLQVVNEGSPQ